MQVLYSIPESSTALQQLCSFNDSQRCLTLPVLLCTQCAGTRELAAMGPANIIFSFSQYVFQALQVAAIRYGSWRAGAAWANSTVNCLP